jgi:heme/copper-type cytochrome/quinol oxidase subunit 2
MIILNKYTIFIIYMVIIFLILGVVIYFIRKYKIRKKNNEILPYDETLQVNPMRIEREKIIRLI